MTLTLEQVRQTRFHLARRNGYEPVDVDNFVDKVEATLAQLSEENATLKEQVEALSSSDSGNIFVPSESGDAAVIDQLRGELDDSRRELEQVRGELAQRGEELDQRAAELQQVRDELAAARAELDQVRVELAAAAAPAEAPGEPAAPAGKVENIVVTSSAEASPAVTRLLQMATEQAERLVGESQAEAASIVGAARVEAESVIDSANKKAHETLTDARGRAEQIEADARGNAERVTAEAQARADLVSGEAEARRNELFTAIEAERDVLRSKVDHLRDFEGNFRTNLTNLLQSQLKALTDTRLEPGDTPELLSEASRGSSSTPRLDALLGEGN